MDRVEFMALESSKKAEVLNAYIDEGKSQKEAMGAVGVSIKDLMSAMRASRSPRRKRGGKLRREPIRDRAVRVGFPPLCA